MMQFEKVKMALSKVTKVLKAGIDLIVLLTNIVLAGLIIWLLIDETKNPYEKMPEFQCKHHEQLSHPIASGNISFLKVILIVLGLFYCYFLEIGFATALSYSVPKRIHHPEKAENIVTSRILKRIACVLLGLLVLLILTKPGIVEVLLPNRYYAARNFLAVCQPAQQLTELCNPNSQNFVIAVSCTTPVKKWMPAFVSVLPKMLIVYYYLSWTSLIGMMYFLWNWMKKIAGLLLLAISIALMVSVGGVTVFYCNEASSSGLFDGCIWTFCMAVISTAIDAKLSTKNEDNFLEEEQLPRYWNDVRPPQKKTIPPAGQPPTTVLTPCGNQNQPARLKPQKDRSIDNPPSSSMYPKLTPELYEWKDVVIGDPGSINRY